ncbi:ANTAR domain-containing protein [Kribbella sp. NPDC003505]|uniref:ANTAR domain-containing protein n=1 Tax=Kribbella sp. NPDC003505 TaxID=3154448 RepID=UPI0033A16C9E
MRTDDEQLARRKAAELADVALRLQSARDTTDLLTVTAELAAAFFGCPSVGVGTLGRDAALLDVAGPAADLLRDDAAAPAGALRRSLEAGEPVSADVRSDAARRVTHVPLIPGRGRAVGVLSLYWPGTVTDLTYVSPFSTHVAVAMESLWYQHRLHASIETHRLVSSSLGVLMERYGIDSREAYEVLSGISLEYNVKLPEIARRVIEDRDLPVSR